MMRNISYDNMEHILSQEKTVFESELELLKLAIFWIKSNKNKLELNEDEKPHYRLLNLIDYRQIDLLKVIECLEQVSDCCSYARDLSYNLLKEFAVENNKIVKGNFLNNIFILKLASGLSSK